MGKTKENTTIDRIVRLDVNDYSGNLIERWKTPVSNKGIGKRIILRLKEIFGISVIDIAQEERKSLDEELRLQEELNKR